MLDIITTRKCKLKPQGYLGCDIVLEFSKMLQLEENGKRVHRIFLSDILQLHLNPQVSWGGEVCSLKIEAVTQLPQPCSTPPRFSHHA